MRQEVKDALNFAASEADYTASLIEDEEPAQQAKAEINYERGRYYRTLAEEQWYLAELIYPKAFPK